MAQLVVTYWRDIPAQVTVKRRREASRRELPPRFMQAIDACAMRVGAKDSDAYTAEWRRGEPEEVGEDLESEADKAVGVIDEAFDRARLATLVKSEGWAA